MVSEGENELICDFAETYRIYDYRSLPLRTAAILACGLREGSRIRRKMSGERCSYTELMTAMIYDRLNWLCWTKTTDAQHGIGCPESLAAKLFKPPEEPELEGFETAEEFEKRRKEIVRGGG